jgi:ribosomal protein S18 acetylase RimI-like enzyme
MGTETTMDVRPADAREIDQLAQVWHDAWHDAHAQIVPAELTRRRTLQSFATRLRASLADVRVVGPLGSPVGLCVVRDSEVHQLFVSREARGTGVAARLLADAEARLSQRGVRRAWLTTAAGNTRAARFYEKSGWHRTRTFVDQLQTAEGPFPLEVWKYEKSLG